MPRELILYLLVVLAGTAGELAVARAMKTVGEAADFRVPALLALALRAVKVGWMWVGISLMAIAFFALLGMLSLENVSFVIPVTALSYAAGTLGGQIFLREKVTGARWAGVSLVCAGVALVLIGKQR